MGIVLNRAIENLTFDDLLKQLDVSPVPPARRIRLHAGGPVEGGRGFVLHTGDWSSDGSLQVVPDLALTASVDILKAIATGGGPRHALVVEHALRPLFGFFSAHTIPSAVYGSDGDFRDGVLVDPGVKARIADAASQLAELLQARAARIAAPEVAAPVAAFASAG